MNYLMENELLDQSSSDYDEELIQLRKDLQIDDRLMTHVDRGMKGLNQGLPNGMKVLNKYIHGTHKARYYLMAADSGVGKTTTADFMFFYNLYKAAKSKGISLKLDYYSFEVSKVMKKARLASLIYFERYKESIPSSLILGEDESETPLRLTKEQYLRVKLVAEEVEEMFDNILFVETPTTPFDMWQRIVARAAEDGEVLRDRDKMGRVSEIVGYKPHKDVFRITIVDHIALLEPQRGLSLKQSIDTASTYFVRARNLFGDSFVVIQQFNSEMQGAARERKGPMAYVPQRRDLGDSSYTFRDADVVMGLSKPYNFQLESFGPFTEFDKWGDYFVLNFIMKNRYGPAPAGGGVPQFLNPIAGYVEELDGKNWNSLLQDVYINKADELSRIAQQ